MGLRTYRPLRAQSAKAKATEAILDDARPRVFKRDGWQCRARVSPDCSGRAEDLHHVIPRSRGGDHSDANLLSVCRACHQWIDAHPAAATEAGLLRSRYG